MASAGGAPGAPAPQPDVYQLSVAPGLSDGKNWNEADYNQSHVRLAEDDEKVTFWLSKLGGMLRDQLLDPSARGWSWLPLLQYPVWRICRHGEC